MKRWQQLIALVVLAVSSSLQGVSAATISMSVTIDGTKTAIPNFFDEASGKYVIGTPGTRDFDLNTTAAKIKDLTGSFDPDPFMFFNGVVQDLGAASNFQFTFVMPLVPQVINPSFVFDSFAGAVTNGPAAGGVTVTALAPPAGINQDGDGVLEMQVFSLSDDGGVTWKNVGLDQGPTTAIPLAGNASGSYGAYNQGYIPTIAGGPWTHMRADVSFKLSGGGDIFTFTGAKVLIPEPASMMLAMLSFCSLCWFRRRTAR